MTPAVVFFYLAFQTQFRLKPHPPSTPLGTPVTRTVMPELSRLSAPARLLAFPCRYRMYVVLCAEGADMKLTSPATEFDPKPMAPQIGLDGPLDALLEWQAMAESAYSPNTSRAQKADGAGFQAFCDSRREAYCRRIRRRYMDDQDRPAVHGRSHRIQDLVD
jgi:hypothetical protein